ncbi:MAG: 3'-5' exonuclease [Bacteroidaceae bacterium]|nr:3'-5' exonuclease [Bacteroidaceae bacterium]
MRLNLKRPLVFFDLEATGVSSDNDRIVEICLIKVFPDGTDEERVWRVNPGIPIPKEASDVHGIYDKDVADKPLFKDLAQTVYDFMNGCDWAGYNSNRFDVPMLIQEFYRAGLRIDRNAINFVDVQNIFYKKEPRTLVAALKFYCGKELENAHSAMADTRATYDVLRAQLERYADDPEIKNDVEALAAYTRMSNNVDLAGKFVKNNDGVVVFNFGQFKNKPVADILRTNPGYYSWFMQTDFPQETKDVLSRIYFQNKRP